MAFLPLQAGPGHSLELEVLADTDPGLGNQQHKAQNKPDRPHILSDYDIFHFHVV